MTSEQFRPMQVEMGLCAGCERCYHVCRANAIYFNGKQRMIDYEKCQGCLSCVTVCPKNAISVDSYEADDIVAIDVVAEKCNGCGACKEACTRELFRSYKYKDQKGDSKQVYGVPPVKVHLCHGCEVCVSKCPEEAISIQKFRINEE